MNMLFDKTRAPHDVLQEAVAVHRPSKVFGLFSGGHDSLTACHIASQHPLFAGCVHINTGIGVEETRHFVRETCERFGWKLWEYHPPVSYEQIVIDHGFPGPAQHGRMYIRLKERCLDQLKREHKTHRHDRLAFVSGARRHESTRRMANATQYHQRIGIEVWCNPILDFTADDKNDYMQRHSLPCNPVVKRLCMSGECLCGAFAEPGELNVIRLFYPQAAAEIDRITEKVKAAGKHCVWGTAPCEVADVDDDQMMLPLCHSCQAKREMADV